MYKKLIFLISFFVFLPTLVFASLSASTVFELRSNGASASGACFDSTVAVPGSDYTQQNSAQYNATDLVVTVGSNTHVTSASHNFVAADEGNCIHITAGTGFTTGYYMITDTSSNEAILDRSPGSVGITGGTFAVGGAGVVEDGVFEAGVAGNTFYIKNDATHTLGASISVSAAGSVSGAINIEGYNSSRGDAPTGTSRPLIAAAANTLTFTGAFWSLRYLQVTTTEASGLKIGASSRCDYCKSTNSSGTANRNGLTIGGANSVISHSEGISTSGEAIEVAASSGGSLLIYNYVHDSATGIHFLTNTSGNAISNIIDTNTTGINSSSGADNIRIYSNTIYNSTTCIAGKGPIWTIENNIFNTCTTGVSFDSNFKSNVDDYNNYSNNSGDVTNITKGSHDTTGGPGFSDAAGGDFTIDATLKDTGFPGAYPAGLSTGHLDPGAVQRLESGSSSGGSFTFVQ